MRALNFTHWNQDYINALSDEDYDTLKSAEDDLANKLQVFLDAYDVRPDEYQGERYINAQELSPSVFRKGIDEEEFCVKFDEHILYGVKMRYVGRGQVGTSGLRWIKLSDVPRVNAIQFKPDFAVAYNNRGIAYAAKGDSDAAFADYNTAIDLDPEDAIAYNNRGEAWLHLKEWEKAKTDLMTAKDMRVDIIACFQNVYKSVEDFEAKNGVKIPKDIAALLRQA